MAVNPGYTRRQELRCTLAELSTYGSVILYEGEVLYVQQADGKYAVKIGDGETNIATLPYAINYSDVATQATAAGNSATAAATSASNAEAFANGTRGGTDIDSDDAAYHKDAKYWAGQASTVAQTTIANTVAEAYDATVAYKVGNLLTYLGKQYYCIADAPAGTLPTNTSYFEEKSVADIVEMIKQGAIVTGHSAVADNLTPYSEDSGTTQENPFISQGTGTDNNSVIVTTGNIARQLEKQGNTVPVMQFVSNSNRSGNINNGAGTNTYVSKELANGTFLAGHKYIVCVKVTNGEARQLRAYVQMNGTSNYGSPSIDIPANGTKMCYWIVNNLTNNTSINLGLSDILTSQVIETGGTYTDACVFDITSWNSDIITDLTSHPEHFSWYYNGSLAYDAGSLANANGRYLECGQGRQLWDEVWEKGYIDSTTGENVADNSYGRSKNYIPVLPNRKIYIKHPNTSQVMYYAEYDNNKSFIKYSAVADSSGYFTASANARWIRIWKYGWTSYGNNVTVSLYYTPEEGGEGYDQYYPYVAPIRIDTGNETLKAFDKKLPSGVIERNTGEVTFDGSDDEAWSIYSSSGSRFQIAISDIAPSPSTSDVGQLVCDKLRLVSKTALSSSEYVISRGDNTTNKILVRITGTMTDVDTFKTWLASNPITIQYPLATPTTEQGTPFSEYADINDYSYMAWFDTDGNLVSIPQGCKLFYPVDYKGFTDDLVMYTEGDATALAKNESITDTALNARGYYKMQDLLTAFGADGMVGGALRHQLAQANSLDFRKTKCVKMADMPWLYHSNGYFYSILQDRKEGSLTMLCTNYGTGSGTGVASITDGQITSGTGNANIFVIDTSCNGNVDTFIEKNKYQLLAYELAD